MEHILRFPDEAVGYLWHDAPAGEEARPIGPAQGVVRVPGGSRLHFAVSDPTRLSCLAPLAPDGLVSVALNKTRVTDADLAALAIFAGLEYLNLSKARAIGDDGVAHLRGLRRLEWLDLYATRVSDAGLPHLGGLSALRRLHLGATRLRGRGLTWLSGLDTLRKLSVEDTRIEDAALTPLTQLPSLQELVLRGTHVTRQGAAEFSRQRPGCTLVGDWEHNEKEADRARQCRLLVTMLVRRIVPRHPISPSMPEDERRAVLRRLFPTGTRLDALAADGTLLADMSFRVDWNLQLDAEDSIGAFLRFVPHQGGVRVTLPGGSRYSVPWLVRRAPERRSALPRGVNRAAN